MLGLTIIFGAAVGFSLGLTGGGGSILAVPLLVYGLAVAPRQAVGISLAAVGTTALVGAIQRRWRGEVEIGTGLMFAIAGMLGAPAGSWIGLRLRFPLSKESVIALMALGRAVDAEPIVTAVLGHRVHKRDDSLPQITWGIRCNPWAGQKWIQPLWRSPSPPVRLTLTR